MEYISRKHSYSYKWDDLHRDHSKDDLLPVWVADMDFVPPAHVVSLLQEYVRYPLGYFRTPEAYFDNFIWWEKTFQHYEVEKEWICFTPGVVPGVQWLLNCFTSEGAAVILHTPAYPHFLQALEECGKKAVISALKRDKEGRFQLDYADFEAKIIENQVEAFILCNPHNPTGTVWTAEELRTLIEICHKHHVYVIADEIHQDFVDTRYAHKSTAASLGDYGDFLFTLTSASKTFNLGGVQNAFLIIENAENRKIVKAYQAKIGISDGNGLGYLATMASYTPEGRKWLLRVLDQIYHNNEIFRQEFTEYPDILFSKLEGTYLLWMDLSSYFRCQEEVICFCEKECGFTPNYGRAFGAKDYDCCIRINLATSEENLLQVAEAIKKHLPQKK